MTGLPLALASAFVSAVGYVLQQHAASEEAAGGGGYVRVILALLRRPVWLGGIAAMIVAQLLSAFALSRGGLTLTEPAFATMLLFALPMSAAWRRTRLGRREWAGTVALSAGAAGFVVAMNPNRGDALAAPPGAWVIAGASVVAVVLTLAVVALRVSASRAATLRGGAAGILLGLQDALTRRSLLLVAVGIAALLQSWSGYALVAVGVTAVLLAQRAFQGAPLAASLPAFTVGEPITGIALGAGLYGEHVALQGVRLAAGLVALGLMIAGLVTVARSPLVERASPAPAPPGRGG